MDHRDRTAGHHIVTFGDLLPWYLSDLSPFVVDVLTQACESLPSPEVEEFVLVPLGTDKARWENVLLLLHSCAWSFSNIVPTGSCARQSPATGSLAFLPDQRDQRSLKT